jgi:hypothetical protein
MDQIMSTLLEVDDDWKKLRHFRMNEGQVDLAQLELLVEARFLQVAHEEIVAHILEYLPFGEIDLILFHMLLIPPLINSHIT